MPQSLGIRLGSRTLLRPDDLVLLLLLAGFVAVSMVISYSLPSHAAPGPVKWLNQRTITEAVSEHAVAGFLVGAAALKIRKAVVGALFQPSIDIDHLSVFLNLPIDPRIGHDVFVPIVLVVALWALRLEDWGALDSALFVSAQFSIHFAIAPSGFPLLGPLYPSTLYFPSLWPGSVGLLLSLLILARALRSGGTVHAP